MSFLAMNVTVNVVVVLLVAVVYSLIDIKRRIYIHTFKSLQMLN